MFWCIGDIANLRQDPEARSMGEVLRLSGSGEDEARAQGLPAHASLEHFFAGADDIICGELVYQCGKCIVMKPAARFSAIMINSVERRHWCATTARLSNARNVMRRWIRGILRVVLLNMFPHCRAPWEERFSLTVHSHFYFVLPCQSTVPHGRLLRVSFLAHSSPWHAYSKRACG